MFHNECSLKPLNLLNSKSDDERPACFSHMYGYKTCVALHVPIGSDYEEEVNGLTIEVMLELRKALDNINIILDIEK